MLQLISYNTKSRKPKTALGQKFLFKSNCMMSDLDSDSCGNQETDGVRDGLVAWTGSKDEGGDDQINN